MHPLHAQNDQTGKLSEVKYVLTDSPSVSEESEEDEFANVKMVRNNTDLMSPPKQIDERSS